MMSNRVQTCIGDIPPSAVGHTQAHEHVLSDMSSIVGTGLWATSGTPADEPIDLDNYDGIRRHVLNRDNLEMTSEADAIAELKLYRHAGGVTIVDSTSVGLGRDPAGLARIAQATGVNIIMGCGYYVRAFHPDGLDEMPAEGIRDEIIRDITLGVDETGIRAGIIGEIGLSWPADATELKVLRAASEAQAMTGAALQVHPGRHERAPFDAIEAVVDFGGNPERTILSHIDRTLTNIDDIIELARTGCWIELDLFGQESSYYAFNPAIDRPNDATRVNWLLALFAAGFGGRLLIAQDICQKVYLRRYGGPGYTHILENVIPLMRRKGMSDQQVRCVTVDNPASILAFG
jgi:phosphotriesterase-related protein